MRWFKTWLRKWLRIDADLYGVMKDSVATEDAISTLTRENADLLQRLNGHANMIDGVGSRVENLREHYASVKEMGEACMARLDRETMKLATAIIDMEKRTGDSGITLTAAIDENRIVIQSIRAELIESVKLADADQKRIAELETIVKDATIDTALAELEDRVAKLESTPPPTPPAQNGRRGGSAWGPHQAAAAAGALLDKGTPNPIPTPGVS